LVRAGLLDLTVVGDGPQRGELETLVARESLTSGVRLTGGSISRAGIRDTSRRPTSSPSEYSRVRGGVVLEAMARRLPPVV